MFTPRIPAQTLPHLAGEEMFVSRPEIPTRLLVNLLVLVRFSRGRERDLIILGDTLTEHHAAAGLPLLYEGATGIHEGCCAFTITRLTEGIILEDKLNRQCRYFIFLCSYTLF